MFNAVNGAVDGYMAGTVTPNWCGGVDGPRRGLRPRPLLRHGDAALDHRGLDVSGEGQASFFLNPNYRRDVVVEARTSTTTTPRSRGAPTPRGADLPAGAGPAAPHQRGRPLPGDARGGLRGTFTSTRCATARPTGRGQRRRRDARPAGHALPHGGRGPQRRHGLPRAPPARQRRLGGRGLRAAPRQRPTRAWRSAASRCPTAPLGQRVGPRDHLREQPPERPGRQPRGVAGEQLHRRAGDPCGFYNAQGRYTNDTSATCAAGSCSTWWAASASSTSSSAPAWQPRRQPRARDQRDRGHLPLPQQQLRRRRAVGPRPRPRPAPSPIERGPRGGPARARGSPRRVAPPLAAALSSSPPPARRGHRRSRRAAPAAPPEAPRRSPRRVRASRPSLRRVWAPSPTRTFDTVVLLRGNQDGPSGGLVVLTLRRSRPAADPARAGVARRRPPRREGAGVKGRWRRWWRAPGDVADGPARDLGD